MEFSQQFILISPKTDFTQDFISLLTLDLFVRQRG